MSPTCAGDELWRKKETHAVLTRNVFEALTDSHNVVTFLFILSLQPSLAGE